jgi:hypothetical protein
LAFALGRRLDILFVDRLDDILMPRLQQLAPGFLRTIDLDPLVERHLDSLQKDFGATWTARIEMASSVLRKQTIRLQEQAIRSITTPIADVSHQPDCSECRIDYIDAQERLAARLDTMAADLSTLQSDCVQRGHLGATTKLLQG